MIIILYRAQGCMLCAYVYSAIQPSVDGKMSVSYRAEYRNNKWRWWMLGLQPTGRLTAQVGWLGLKVGGIIGAAQNSSDEPQACRSNPPPFSAANRLTTSIQSPCVAIIVRYRGGSLYLVMGVASSVLLRHVCTVRCTRQTEAPWEN